jgi:hypothetical protein
MAEMRSSDISGVLLDKSFFNDVIGTYMQYTVSVAVPLRLAQKFEELYDLITEPVESHVFVLPYGQTTIQIVGRVGSVSDTYMYMDGKRNYWNGFKFTVISNYPTKEQELGDVLEHGMSPMPSTIGIEDGATFTWDDTEGVWNVAAYRDADEVYY